MVNPRLTLSLNFEASPSLPLELSERIYLARYSGKLSDCAHDVLFLLVDHPCGPRAGRVQALSIASMQECWMRAGTHVWDDRSVKATVKDLIEELGIAIGSSRSPSCPGYYLAVTTEDLEASERPLRAEIISLAKRLRTFNPKSDFARHLAGQIEITDPTHI